MNLDLRQSVAIPVHRVRADKRWRNPQAISEVRGQQLIDDGVNDLDNRPTTADIDFLQQADNSGILNNRSGRHRERRKATKDVWKHRRCKLAET